MRVLYGLIKVFSILIRQFILPNPFASLQNGALYNIYASIILVPITFWMVGFLYERSFAPVWGSILFLLIYLVNTAFLLLCGIFKFHVIACLIIGLVYITIFTGLVKFRSEFGGGY